MRSHLFFLCALLFGAAGIAGAGPNQGGVLVVHDTGLIYSLGWTAYDNAPPADCYAVDNRAELGLSNAVAWKIYAMFPEGSRPRLKSIEVGEAISHNGGGACLVLDAGLPDPVNDLELPRDGWPTTDGGGTGISYLTTRTSTVSELYWFAGYSYAGAAGETQSFAVTPYRHQPTAFVDDCQPTPEEPDCPHMDPVAGFGSLGFGADGFTPCPADGPIGACCSLNGLTCAITTEAGCPAPSIWHPAAEHPEFWACVPNPCPAPTGACCRSSGECTVITERVCGNLGGRYMGDFASCLPSPCPPAGVCCLVSGSCLVRTEESCRETYPGSSWRPELNICDPNPCPGPGACCLISGDCLTLTEEHCLAAYPEASWQTERCYPNPCRTPGPSRACCAPDGSCTVRIEPFCTLPAIWHPDWRTCVPNVCPQPPGACCDFTTGSCEFVLEEACRFDWMGPGVPCSPALCIDPDRVEQTSWGRIKDHYR